MTKNELHNKDFIRYILLIIFGLLITGNTNNNPNIFVQRVFHPLKLGDITIFYAGLIPMIMIYKGLKGIYICKKTEKLRTRSKRIIATIALLIIFLNCWNFGLKAFKGLAGGLDSIYCDRDKMWLNVHEVDENKVKISTRLNLENCSFEEQGFYIKLKIPKEWQDYIEEEEIIVKKINSDVIDKFYVNKHQKTHFRVEAIGTSRNGIGGNMSIGSFDFVLFNDEEEVIFKGRNSLY